MGYSASLKDSIILHNIDQDRFDTLEAHSNFAIASCRSFVQVVQIVRASQRIHGRNKMSKLSELH